MKTSEARKGIFRTRIEVGDFFGVAKEDAWVEMREPTMDEMMALKRDGEDSQQRFVNELAPACLVDHNFESDDGTKAETEEVVSVLRSSSGAYSHVVRTWEASLPLTREAAGRSDS